MKSFDVNNKRLLTKEEKEFFFQLLENDKTFFKEAFETMLTIVTSDPILTYQVADLIETEFRDIYLVIMKKLILEKAASDTSSCCRDL